MNLFMTLFGLTTAIIFGMATYSYSRKKKYNHPILLGTFGFLLPPVLISVLSDVESSDGRRVTQILWIIFIRAIIVLPILFIVCLIGNMFHQSSLLGILYAPSLKIFLRDMPLFIQGNIVELGGNQLVLYGSGALFGGMVSLAVFYSAFFVHNWLKYSCICIVLSLPLALISDWSRIIRQVLDATHISNVTVSLVSQHIFLFSVYLLIFFSTYLAYRSHTSH